jgi:hypothetical protein
MKGEQLIPRARYSALSLELASIKPTSTLASQYTPSSDPPALCHNFTSWELIDRETHTTGSKEVSTILPSKPYRRSCSCMMETLNCLVDKNVDLASTYERRQDLCKEDVQWCQAVENAGAWQGCNTTEKISWTLNALYKSRGSNASACSSVGGVVRRPVPTASLARDCQSMLSQAGPDGRGQITITPIPLKDSLLLTREDIEGSGLTRSAKIGISVGVVVGIVLLILLIFLRFYFKAKRKKRDSALEDSKEQRVEQLDGNEVKELDTSARQLGSNELYELETPSAVELPAVGVHELSAEDNRVVKNIEKV